MSSVHQYQLFQDSESLRLLQAGDGSASAHTCLRRGQRRSRGRGIGSSVVTVDPSHLALDKSALNLAEPAMQACGTGADTGGTIREPRTRQRHSYNASKHRIERAVAVQKLNNGRLVERKSYNGIQVWEMKFNNTVVMKRCDDGWMNATQILALDELERRERLKASSGFVHQRVHYKVQGGQPIYQGTWVSLKDARELCQQRNVYHLLKPLLKPGHDDTSRPKAPLQCIDASVHVLNKVAPPLSTNFDFSATFSGIETEAEVYDSLSEAACSGIEQQHQLELSKTEIRTYICVRGKRRGEIHKDGTGILLSFLPPRPSKIRVSFKMEVEGM